MTATTADLPQLRAQLGALAARNSRQGAVAVRAAAAWSGPAEFELDGRRVRVVACRSPLDVRTALDVEGGTTDGAPSGTALLALLTPCDEHALGTDVLARLIGQRVWTLDPFEAMPALFSAKVADPLLVRERWLIDDLIAVAPSGGWPVLRPLNGVVSLETAFQAWQSERLALATTPSSVDEVVALCADASFAARLARLEAEHRQRLSEYWARTSGSDAVAAVLTLATSGWAELVVPLGLALRCLFSPADEATGRAQALARRDLKQLFDRELLDERSALEWAAAAERWCAARPAESVEVFARAEAWIEGAEARELISLSAVLPRGLEARLDALGRAVLGGRLPEAHSALQLVLAHRGADRRRTRIQMAHAAVAVMRRRPPSEPAPATLAEAARRYAEDTSWVDRARTLLRRGESNQELAAAYSALCDRLDTERVAENRRFAELLIDWSRAEPLPAAGVVPLEGVLSDVVAPVAKAAPVLLLVLDGLARSVAHELFERIAHDGWAPIRTVPESATPIDWPSGVALLPTVTSVSRTSLLCGARVVGGQKEEQAGFTANPALGAVSPKLKPPVLFHKGQLVGPSGVALPAAVHTAITDPAQRVVGVVVNAIDDHLGGANQLHIGWDLDSLPALGWLLDAAAEAGRTVIITADHGHVLDAGAGSFRRSGGGTGERWRVAPPEPDDREVVVSGPRVLLGNGTIVAPVDEHLRYGEAKNGYHGGVTPQEVLVPIAVFARTVPAGWERRALPRPAWWNGDLPNEPEPEPVLPAPRRSPAKPAPVPAQESLFAAVSPVAAPPSAPSGDWIDQLLAAPAFVANRQRVPRSPSDERIRATLTAIHRHGGRIPINALAQRLGEPADTLQLALRPLQRLLNVDGTTVLSSDPNGDVELNRPMLAVQFEVSVP